MVTFISNIICHTTGVKIGKEYKCIDIGVLK